MKKKLGWKYGSSGIVPAWQVQGLSSNTNTTKIKIKIFLF
jgi:hypothetical protein